MVYVEHMIARDATIYSVGDAASCLADLTADIIIKLGERKELHIR